MHNNPSDAELIQAYLEGDERALRQLFERYLKPLYNFVFQYVGNAGDAEDVTQETFVKAWKKLKLFDSAKSFKTWIFSIAKNTSIDFLRKKKTLNFSDFQDDCGKNPITDTLRDDAPFPDELALRAENKKKLNEAVTKLSPQYRVVLFLYYHDGFNFREIAEILDESIDTVKSRHRRALLMLKKELH